MEHPEREVPLVRLGGPDPGPARLIALAAALIVIAIVKPWAWFGIAAPAGSTVASPPAERESRSPASTKPLPRATSIAASAPGYGPCYANSGWRVTTVDSMDGGRRWTWYSLEPGSASAPSDASIPVVHIYARHLDALGFCAAVDGGIRTPIVAVEGWALGGAKPVPIELLRIAALSPESTKLGSLYAPPAAALPSAAAGSPAARQTRPTPGAARAGGWPGGRYVFVVRSGEGDPEDAWFAVDIVEVPDPSAAAGSHGPPASPRP